MPRSSRWRKSAASARRPRDRSWACSRRQCGRNLTVQDNAFLRALYRLNLDRQAMQHRGALIGQITDALTASNP